jgi:excisionase family DNA binding protein
MSSRDDILTIDEAAVYLKISPRLLYKLVKQNKIPAMKLSNKWRFDRDVLKDWIARKGVRTMGLEE